MSDFNICDSVSHFNISRVNFHSMMENTFVSLGTSSVRNTVLPTPHAGIFLSGGPGGIAPLNFDNPKRSKMWYVTCGTIICRVAGVTKCESSAIDFWIFFKPFLDVLLDIWTSERCTERSTILDLLIKIPLIKDLLIKIPGPLNPATYW